MSLEISHIVVNGCSFTYCQGLDAPWVHGWPALLANKLNVPVVNLCVPGSGNDGILRRTTEYFYKNKHLPGKPLYIIAFSHATRREEFFKSYKGKQTEDYLGLDLSASAVDLVSSLYDFNDKDLYEYAHIMHLSYEACERKKFLNWSNIVNLFRANNIPYITADYMPTFDDNVIEYMEKNYSEIYYECLRDKNYAGRLCDVTKHFKKTSCGHDPLDAMPLVCDALFKKITEIYGKVNKFNSQDKMFLNLKEFYSERTRSVLAWNLWLQNS